MNGVMIDLETLGNRPGSVLLAIGAVCFGGGKLGERFYTRIDPQSCVDVGLQMDVSTVMWWLQQSDVARAEICKPGIPLSAALGQFTAWVLSETVDAEVWGNGASFDNTLLVEAYRACRLEPPWKFWSDRCYRTVKGLHPHVRLQRSGTHHNAMDDAETQALHLMEILASGRTVSA